MNIKNNNVSIFSRLDSDLFVSDENVVRVKGAYYGKMLKFKLMGRSICRYNASLIVEQLKHNNGKYCNMMRKLIHSCIANGAERGFRANNLYIRSISVGPGTYLKRREFKGRGKSGAIWRPYSKVTLELKEIGVDIKKKRGVFSKSDSNVGQNQELNIQAINDIMNDNEIIDNSGYTGSEFEVEGSELPLNNGDDQVKQNKIQSDHKAKRPGSKVSSVNKLSSTDDNTYRNTNSETSDTLLNPDVNQELTTNDIKVEAGVEKEIGDKETSDMVNNEESAANIIGGKNG